MLSGTDISLLSSESTFGGTSLILDLVIYVYLSYILYYIGTGCYPDAY